MQFGMENLSVDLSKDVQHVVIDLYCLGHCGYVESHLELQLVRCALVGLVHDDQLLRHVRHAHNLDDVFVEHLVDGAGSSRTELVWQASWTPELGSDVLKDLDALVGEDENAVEKVAVGQTLRFLWFSFNACPRLTHFIRNEQRSVDVDLAYFNDSLVGWILQVRTTSIFFFFILIPCSSVAFTFVEKALDSDCVGCFSTGI
jgi:hypothetical protein